MLFRRKEIFKRRPLFGKIYEPLDLNLALLMYKNEKGFFNSVIIFIGYQLCPLADEWKYMRGKMIALKRMASGKGKEEGE